MKTSPWWAFLQCMTLFYAAGVHGAIAVQFYYLIRHELQEWNDIIAQLRLK